MHSSLISLTATSVLATAVYFWLAERDTYRASWRVHASGIALPIALMAVSRDPVIWSIAAAFATVHVASIVSESVAPKACQLTRE